jgi:hypothetical protein
VTIRLCAFVSVALCAIALCANAAARTGNAVLESLRAQLVSVRAMAPGSRPAHPAIDIKSLVGLRRATIANALGIPTYCEPPSSSCVTSRGWKYDWGPPAETQLPQADGEIFVTTGGPWLLIFEFSQNHVIAAYWQGQR